MLKAFEDLLTWIDHMEAELAVKKPVGGDYNSVQLQHEDHKVGRVARLHCRHPCRSLQGWAMLVLVPNPIERRRSKQLFGRNRLLTSHFGKGCRPVCLRGPM